MIVRAEELVCAACDVAFADKLKSIRQKTRAGLLKIRHCGIDFPGDYLRELFPDPQGLLFSGLRTW